MKVILEPRQCGKTTQMIEWSHGGRGRLLVCTSKREASRVFRESLRLERPITFPITADEFFRGNFNVHAFTAFGIDNLDLVLGGICPLPIELVTITGEGTEKK